MNSRKGHCHCEQVQFEFDGDPVDVNLCHCSICRRLTGTAFGAYVKVRESDFRVVSGAGNLTRYPATERLDFQFCRICGSHLFTSHRKFPDYTYVCLGTVTDNEGIAPAYHEFAGSKASWFDITDNLPRFRNWSTDEPVN